MKKCKAIVIGGSAGSFSVVIRILKVLPKDYKIPIILCMHRLKHVREGFVEALAMKSNLKIIEPNDKDKIVGGVAYLAPANYHLYVELNHTIALSTEEVVNFSRPSIDLTLDSAGFAYRNSLVGIILSGANRDGAWGLKKIKDYGGTVIIQSPSDCKIKTMPEAAKSLTEVDYELTTEEIINYLLKLNE